MKEKQELQNTNQSVASKSYFSRTETLHKSHMALNGTSCLFKKRKLQNIFINILNADTRSPLYSFTAFFQNIVHEKYP